MVESAPSRLRLCVASSLLSSKAIERGLERSWYQLSPSLSRISELCDQVIKDLPLRGVTARELSIQMDGFALPLSQSCSILRDGDLISIDVVKGTSLALTNTDAQSSGKKLKRSTREGEMREEHPQPDARAGASSKKQKRGSDTEQPLEPPFAAGSAGLEQTPKTPSRSARRKAVKRALRRQLKATSAAAAPIGKKKQKSQQNDVQKPGNKPTSSKGTATKTTATKPPETDRGSRGLKVHERKGNDKGTVEAAELQKREKVKGKANAGEAEEHEEESSASESEKGASSSSESEEESSESDSSEESSEEEEEEEEEKKKGAGPADAGANSKQNGGAAAASSHQVPPRDNASSGARPAEPWNTLWKAPATAAALPPLGPEELPCVGDVVTYQVVELTASGMPEMCGTRQGKVDGLEGQGAGTLITMSLWPPQARSALAWAAREHAKAEAPPPQDDNWWSPQGNDTSEPPLPDLPQEPYAQDGSLVTERYNLVDVRVLSRSPSSGEAAAAAASSRPHLANGSPPQAPHAPAMSAQPPAAPARRSTTSGGGAEAPAPPTAAADRAPGGAAAPSGNPLQYYAQVSSIIQQRRNELAQAAKGNKGAGGPAAAGAAPQAAALQQARPSGGQGSSGAGAAGLPPLAAGPHHTPPAGDNEEARTADSVLTPKNRSRAKVLVGKRTPKSGGVGQLLAMLRSEDSNA